MGIVDIVLLIIIGIFAIKGLLKGLVLEIFGLIALVAGYIVAFKYSHVFAKPVAAIGFSDKASGSIGFVLAFLAAYLLTVIIGAFLSKAFKEVSLGALNKGGGFFFGGIKAAVLLGLLLSAVITISPKDAAFNENLRKGPVSGTLAKVSPFVYRVMNSIPEVKKIEPFDVPKVKMPENAIDMLENDAVNDALDAVKNTKDKAVESAKEFTEKAKETAESLTGEEPPEDPLKDMQKE